MACDGKNLSIVHILLTRIFQKNGLVLVLSHRNLNTIRPPIINAEECQE
jgi:hypothetical protein